MSVDLYNFKLYRYPKKLVHAVHILLRQKYFSNRIRSSRREKIVFVVPNGCFISGGILSIINMYHIAVGLFPQKDVFLATLASFQKADTYRDVKTDARVINLKYFLPDWLEQGDKILLHVYEDGLMAFLENIKKMGLLPKLKNVTLNILNQNQNFMPSEKEVGKYAHYFGKVTMTLAYESNIKDNQCKYLDMAPKHVGAYFEGEDPELVPFGKKENLCVLSDDKHPLKAAVKKKLIENGIEVYDTYPVPYNEFVRLQKRAKWTVSFGEGWDGYTMGQFNNGGIGFGVYQPEFAQSYFDAGNLPLFLFDSYEEMAERILERIALYDDAGRFEEENRKWVSVMAQSYNINSREKVRERWIDYYRQMGMLDSSAPAEAALK